MKTPLQQSLIYRSKSTEKSRTPNPGITCRRPFGANNNRLTILIGKSILIESLPLAFMTGERLGDVFRCFFTRQLPINDPGNAGSGLFIGMHMIGKTLFHTCQRSMQIDYFQLIFSSQLIDNRHHAVYNRTVINPPLYSIGGNRVTQVDFRF